ncbi:MAG TPA: SIMPL domain-containing protein [Pyrinomonadaceae bacterium]|jgi:hypothetical protein
MKLLISLLGICLFSVTGFSQYGDVSRAPTIEVTGIAEISVVPDEVSISLNVSKTDKNLNAAKSQNDQAVATVIALTKKFGIDTKDVKTDFITVREKNEKRKLPKADDEYQDVFVGYTVSKTVVVKLRDIKKFEDFFSEAIGSGVSQISNVVYSTSQLRKYKDDARAMAVRAAREKATALTREIGQTIGKAVSIEEENVDGFRSSYANVSSNSFTMSDQDSEASDTFSVGTISVKAQVKVEFLLN